MAIYAIGDVQGCADELELLLAKLNLDPTNDQVWFVGDLVNRGPKSLETLRLVKGLGRAAITVLGNHDLHLLALGRNPEAPVNDSWLRPVLAADDRDDLLAWLIRQPLAHFDTELNTLLVHAGVPPDWTVNNVLRYASEVEKVLCSDVAGSFFASMYGSKPTRWNDDLSNMDRLRFITNSLTRIRYCTLDGELEFVEKLAPGNQPEHLVPWFELPNRATDTTRIVFGHWSTLGLLELPDLIATDTGCVWGGKLTAVRLDQQAPPTQVDSLQPQRF